MTAAFLRDFLVERGVPNGPAHRLAVVAGGHHGIFPDAASARNIRDIASEIREFSSREAWTGIRAHHLQ